ncbi:CBO0543 family protein [Clostridium algoriphilum]|uniref:CBO0543 family protein n=1 Tax=Clostridium algoriphilum TaxID=198347 RepID=UPI003850FE1F
MYHIFLAVVSIVICYKLGDWRNWRKYYSTILFLILSNVVCILLTYNHILWLHETKILNHTFGDLFICITVYPSIVMLFIPNFPKKITKIITHISFYVAIFTMAEFIGLKFGYFTHHNGWSIWLSIIFNYTLFSIVYLHYKKPLYAWIIALLSPHILFFLMRIPYNSIK